MSVAELEAMHERMAGMVSKSRLDALQDDYDRMLAEHDSLRDSHKGMVYYPPPLIRVLI